MPERDHSVTASRARRCESEPAFRQLERHSNRILAAGALIAANIVLLETARFAQSGKTWLYVSVLALVASMLLLMHRLVVRAMRFAMRSARRHARLSQTMMQAVERFARESAGTRGTIDALCQAAADAGCEAIVWDEATRTLLDPAHAGRYALTPAATERLLTTMTLRRVVTVPDVSVLSALPVDLARRSSTCAIVFAPMWAGSQFAGLVLKRYSKFGERRSPQDADLVSGLAALGAVAIGKAQVVDSEQQRARDNELLLRSVEVASEPGRRVNLSDYALQAAQALGADMCAIWSVAAGQLRLSGTHGIDRSSVIGSRRIPRRASLASIVERSGTGTRIESVDGLDEWSCSALSHLGFGGQVTVQGVLHRGQFVGVIVAGNANGDSVVDLGDREGALLNALSRQVSMTLERDRMARSMNKRSRHLAQTPKLARALTGLREPASVARTVARELHDGFGFGRVSVALGSEEGALRIAANAGMLAQAPDAVRTTEVLEQTRRLGRPYVSCAGETRVDGSTPSIDDPNAPANCHSMIAVPIHGSESTCLGVIAVYERDPEALTEDDLHMLETIADQLSSTLEQASLIESLEQNFFRTVEALAAALEAKDAYTLSHAQSITGLAEAVGRTMGMSDASIHDLKYGALLHDIGKIGVPSEILNKEGPLTDDEFEIMKEHTIIGEQIIAPIEFLSGVRPLVLHEHERWDGKGYPHGICGEDIPWGARIIFVCDSWHAMTSNRPYRMALPDDEARSRLIAGAGSQFDPDVVDAFLKVIDDPALMELIEL